MDTIFAPASGRVRAGICVIRVSGPLSANVVETLTGAEVPEPRKLVLRSLRDGDGELLDTGLVAFFPEGSSFTGEASAELHVHGSIAVVDALVRCLGKLPGVRMAEPGEFSRRALENGKLDLAQIEGLADLIAAETDVQRRQAQRLASGGLRDDVAGWRRLLVRALALIEACIDFPDEEIPVSVIRDASVLIGDLHRSLKREIDGFGMAERIRDGFEVAIIGPPNVGKSTLLNTLAGRDAAITSAVAGTTRDVIEVRMDIGGLPVTLLDTAGLRESDDPVEAMGVGRARERALAADLLVILVSAPGERPLVEARDGDLVVLGRADLHPGYAGPAVSGLSGDGVDDLTQAIARVLSARVLRASGITRVRQRDALMVALEALEMAGDRLENAECGIELAAEALRSCMRALERLVGQVDVEDVLGELFGSFCIGK